MKSYVSFLIRLAAFQASGAARMKLRQNGTVFYRVRLAALPRRVNFSKSAVRMKFRLAEKMKRLNVEHRTSNTDNSETILSNYRDSF